MQQREIYFNFYSILMLHKLYLLRELQTFPHSIQFPNRFLSSGIKLCNLLKFKPYAITVSLLQKKRQQHVALQQMKEKKSIKYIFQLHFILMKFLNTTGKLSILAQKNT